MPPPRSPVGSISKRASPTALRLAGFVLLAILVYVAVQAQIDDVELVEVTPYFFVAIALQFTPFVVRSRADLFEPASIAGAQMLLALVPAFTSVLVQGTVSIGLLPMVIGRARIELVQTVLIAYSVGSVAYFVGYYLPLGKRATFAFPDIAGREWNRSRLLGVSAVCAAVFIPAYAYFQSRVGASITDITQLAAGKAVWREDSTMSWLMRATGLGFIPVLFYVAIHFRGLPVPRWIPGIPGVAHAVHLLRHVPPFFKTPKGRRALFTIVGFFVVGFLTTRLGQRGTALYIALSAVMIVHYIWRRLPTTLVVALAFVAMVVTNVLGAYRTNRDESTATMPGPTANFNAAETLVEHEDDRQRFAAMAVVFHHFPDRRDYLMGESWAAVGTILVPRWLWPDKAKVFVWRDTNIVPELVGSPVPVNLLAMLYANFSWLGIVLGMGLLGVYQRGMYEWLLKNQKDKNVVVFYSLGVLYLVPTLIQLSSAVGYLLPAYVTILFIGKKAARAKGALPHRPAGPAAPPRALSASSPEPGPTAAE